MVKRVVLKVIVPEDKQKLLKQIAALEYAIKNDINSKDKEIHKQALKDLQEKLLFGQYLEMQSKEWKEDILGYESFVQEGHDLAIKVNFTWGWLRVYYTKNGQIEWY